MLALAETIEHAKLPGVTEVIATFRSLSINYDSLITTGNDLEQAVHAFVNQPSGTSGGKRLWQIPVCYEPEFAPDIEEIAKAAKLSVQDVISLHSSTQYHVYMIGFVPGFPYMGDVPEKLQFPRRSDPRTRVPPGSVAIATSMTAVYPYESPGGWHLIGTTPVRFFDADVGAGRPARPWRCREIQSGRPGRIRTHQAGGAAEQLCSGQCGDCCVTPVFKVVAPVFSPRFKTKGGAVSSM